MSCPGTSSFDRRSRPLCAGFLSFIFLVDKETSYPFVLYRVLMPVVYMLLRGSVHASMLAMGQQHDPNRSLTHPHALTTCPACSSSLQALYS